MSKRIFKRTEAIKILEKLNREAIENEEIDSYEFKSMSNLELEAELCLSGYIHNTDMGGVVE
jgi:hypothetical protein